MSGWPRNATGSVTLTWLTSVDEPALCGVRDLFDAALALDDMIGFSGPLTDEQAAEYFIGLRLDVDLGRKALLLGRAPDGAVVAMAVLTPNGLPNCRHLAEISKCIVHPEWRGSGVVRRGLAELLAFCRARGIDTLTLDVRKGTRAETLWKGLGFEPYGELPDYARTATGCHAGTFLWASVNALLARRPR
jgi:ribosomal protein S18 acetylase RimI-like enzyme